LPRGTKTEERNATERKRGLAQLKKFIDGRLRGEKMPTSQVVELSNAEALQSWEGGVNSPKELAEIAVSRIRFAKRRGSGAMTRVRPKGVELTKGSPA